MQYDITEMYLTKRVDSKYDYLYDFFQLWLRSRLDYYKAYKSIMLDTISSIKYNRTEE